MITELMIIGVEEFFFNLFSALIKNFQFSHNSTMVDEEEGKTCWVIKPNQLAVDKKRNK